MANSDVRFRAAKVLKAYTLALQRGMVAVGVQAQTEVKRQLSKGSSRRGANPAPAGAPPHVGTGHLRRSWQIDASAVSSATPMVRVGSNVPYARILEYGGTIYPVNAKMLAVPWGPVGATEARRAGGRIRDIPNLVLITRKNGKPPLLVRIEGKGTRKGKAWVPMFALVPKVKINAHPYVRPARAALIPKIPAIVNRFIPGALVQAGVVARR